MCSIRPEPDMHLYICCKYCFRVLITIMPAFVSKNRFLTQTLTKTTPLGKSDKLQWTDKSLHIQLHTLQSNKNGSSRLCVVHVRQFLKRAINLVFPATVIKINESLLATNQTLVASPWKEWSTGCSSTDALTLTVLTSNHGLQSNDINRKTPESFPSFPPSLSRCMNGVRIARFTTAVKGNKRSGIARSCHVAIKRATDASLLREISR